MIEIYKEQLIDLLNIRPLLTGDHLKDEQKNFQSKKLKLKEKLLWDGTTSTYIEGATSATIKSYTQINQLIKLGEKNRHVNSTNLNR